MDACWGIIGVGMDGRRGATLGRQPGGTPAPGCSPAYMVSGEKGNPMPKAGGNRGRLAILIFSSSASWSLFDLALRFWNQIFTCVSLRLSADENSARSAMERYCFSRNFRSSARSCCVVNGVRGFRLALCLRSWQVLTTRGGSGRRGTQQRETLNQYAQRRDKNARMSDLLGHKANGVYRNTDTTIE